MSTQPPPESQQNTMPPPRQETTAADLESKLVTRNLEQSQQQPPTHHSAAEQAAIESARKYSGGRNAGVAVVYPHRQTVPHVSKSVACGPPSADGISNTTAATSTSDLHQFHGIDAALASTAPNTASTVSQQPYTPTSPPVRSTTGTAGAGSSTPCSSGSLARSKYLSKPSLTTSLLQQKLSTSSGGGGSAGGGGTAVSTAAGSNVNVSQACSTGDGVGGGSGAASLSSGSVGVHVEPNLISDGVGLVGGKNVHHRQASSGSNASGINGSAVGQASAVTTKVSVTELQERDQKIALLELQIQALSALVENCKPDLTHTKVSSSSPTQRHASRHVRTGSTDRTFTGRFPLREKVLRDTTAKSGMYTSQNTGNTSQSITGSTTNSTTSRDHSTGEQSAPSTPKFNTSRNSPSSNGSVTPTPSQTRHVEATPPSLPQSYHHNSTFSALHGTSHGSAVQSTPAAGELRSSSVDNLINSHQTGSSNVGTAVSAGATTPTAPQASSTSNIASSLGPYQGSGSETEAERDLAEELQATCQELEDAQETIGVLTQQKQELLTTIDEFKSKLTDHSDAAKVLRKKIERDAETIKHIRESSQEGLLDETRRDFVLSHMAIIREELVDIMRIHGETDLNTAKTRLEKLIEACVPDADRLPLPDILNDSIERAKELETLLITTSHHRDIEQRKNDELEEELDAQRKETKKSLTELSEFVDKLRQALDQSRAENEQLKEKIFELEDAVEQQIAINKYDKHLAEKYCREVEQIEDQKIEVQKKYDQLLRTTQIDKEEHEQCLQELENKINTSNQNREHLLKTVNSLRDENKQMSETHMRVQVENDKLRRSLRHASPVFPISRANSELSDTEPTASERRHSLLSEQSQQVPTTSVPVSPANVPNPEPSRTPLTDKLRCASPPSIKIPNEAPVQSPLAQPGPHPMLGSSTRSSKSSLSGSLPHSHFGAATSTASVERMSQNIRNLISSYETASSPTNQQRGAHGFITQPLPNTTHPPVTHHHHSPSSASTASSTSGIIMSKVPTAYASPPSSITATNGTTYSKLTTTKSSTHLPSMNSDPLSRLALRYGGSKRNGLLKWCQERTKDYKHVEITNFSSSWSDGLALCSLLHTYLPNHIPWKKLSPANRQQNLQIALRAAQAVNIYTETTIEEFLNVERPDWSKVMNLVASIYKFFET